MKFLVIFFSLLVIPFSHAAILKGTNGVELVALDGHEIKSGMFQNDNLNLTDGDHQVVVKYSKRINDDMVYSKPHIFAIDVKGDTEITVKRFNNKSQAKYAIRKGLIWIVKNELPTKNVVGESIFKEGFQIHPDIESLIVEYNQAHGLAPIDEESVATICTPAQLDDLSKTQQLIRVYSSSTSDEKKAFRIWLAQND